MEKAGLFPVEAKTGASRFRQSLSVAQKVEGNTSLVVLFHLSNNLDTIRYFSSRFERRADLVGLCIVLLIQKIAAKFQNLQWVCIHKYRYFLKESALMLNPQVLFEAHIAPCCSVAVISFGLHFSRQWILPSLACIAICLMKVMRGLLHLPFCYLADHLTGIIMMFVLRSLLSSLLHANA